MSLIPDGLQNRDMSPFPDPEPVFGPGGLPVKILTLMWPIQTPVFFIGTQCFSVPKGAQLHLEGEFPHSRYMSLISYDERGAPVESLADYLIVPNDGAVNPYIEGANRNSDQRGHLV